MATFLDLFGFISVLLRAATLSLSSVAIGGVLFATLVNARKPLNRAGRRLLTICAAALAIGELLSVSGSSAMLQATAALTIRELVGANFFAWGSAGFLAALCLGFLAIRGREASLLAQLCAALILTCEVATSHAAARLTDQALLIVFTALHQAATAAWIGGLPYLVLTLRTSSDALLIAQRFSRLSLFSVGALLAAGAGLSYYYVGSPQAIYGTTYGLMVCAKLILFACVLTLGAINFRIVRELKTGTTAWTARIATIGEAEIGIGITVLLAAASLTSQAPGVDLTADRVTMPVITARMTPEVPRLRTPPLTAISPSTREAWKKQHPVAKDPNAIYFSASTYNPPNAGDIAWSEYNHHWAGLIVLLVGVLAICSRFLGWKWARHWPLAFTGLALFLLLRADPEAWPLGPDGFWESFTVADVAQHRLFVVLIVLFAAFEWGVQTGRLKSRTAALVFPAVCAAGGALLLTHTHSTVNIQEELLAELSHLPIALFAVTAGWARWLELRYPGENRRRAAYIWPVCFALIGVGLLLYREA